MTGNGVCAMRKAVVAIPFVVVLFAVAVIAPAQQPGRAHRIAFLGGSSASAYASFVEAFQQQLRDLGYIEGKSFVIEHRYGDGKLARLPELAAELVHLGIDVIVVS